MLKVVLIGYGELAQSLLIGLTESKHKVVGVLRWDVERPNKPLAFLRDLFIPDALTSIIRAGNIHEIKTGKANSKKFIKKIKKLAPDVILVGSWGEIFKKEIINLPKVAFINCHPSFLPMHRGSNPYASVIKNGESKTGITFHLMNEGIDTGEILLQKEINISENDTGGSIRNKCAFTAKNSVSELLDKLEKAELIPKKQDESKASYFPKLKPKDAKISWKKPAKEIHNNIRALLPWIKSYTLHKDTFLYIQSTKIIELNTSTTTPGIIIDKKGKNLIISTADTNKAILTENIETYGFLSKLWSNHYINKKIKIGDYLQEV